MWTTKRRRKSVCVWINSSLNQCVVISRDKSKQFWIFCCCRCFGFEVPRVLSVRGRRKWKSVTCKTGPIELLIIATMIRLSIPDSGVTVPSRSLHVYLSRCWGHRRQKKHFSIHVYHYLHICLIPRLMRETHRESELLVCLFFFTPSQPWRLYIRAKHILSSINERFKKYTG